MKIFKAESSLFLCLTVLLVGQATAEFTFIELDEEGSEGRNLSEGKNLSEGRNLREGSKWGTFGFDFCIEPVRKKLGSRFRLTKCVGKDLPTRDQQFRFRKDADDNYGYFNGKLEWRGKRGRRKWCVDVKDELKGGKPLVLAPCGKRGIARWRTDTEKTQPIGNERLCIVPRTNAPITGISFGEEGDLVIVTNCDKNDYGSFDFKE
eukprot:scaffold5117_cov44-Attheya_sp.AAC.3